MVPPVLVRGRRRPPTPQRGPVGFLPVLPGVLGNPVRPAPGRDRRDTHPHPGTAHPPDHGRPAMTGDPLTGRWLRHATTEPVNPNRVEWVGYYGPSYWDSVTAAPPYESRSREIFRQLNTHIHAANIS